MNRLLLLHLALSVGLPAQVLPLHHQIKHLPYFAYPAIPRVARIQGKVDLLLTVENGKVVDVKPASGEKPFPLPQLALPTAEVAKRIEFLPGTFGSIPLHLVFRIAPAEGLKTTMEIVSKSGWRDPGAAVGRRLGSPPLS